MQNPSQNPGHKICSFAVSVSCVFLFLFHPHLSVYVSHIKDFDPYLKKIENPLKDCEHDLMDKFKKKKNSQWQVEDGSEGAESQRSVIVFLDLNPEMAPHSSWSPPTLAAVQCPWMDTWPQGNHQQFWQSEQWVSYSFLREAEWVPGTDLQESMFTKPQMISAVRFQSHHPVECESRDTEIAVSGSGYQTRVVMMLGPEAIWGQMPSEWLEDIAWGVEEQERQKKHRDLCSWISICSRPTIFHFISPWKWKWKSLSRVWLFVTPWTIQSMEVSRPEYWSG